MRWCETCKRYVSSAHEHKKMGHTIIWDKNDLENKSKEKRYEEQYSKGLEIPARKRKTNKGG